MIIGSNLYPNQVRAIKKFDTLLKDKTIVAIEKQTDDVEIQINKYTDEKTEIPWFTIEYENGQKFRCRGIVPNESHIFEKSKQKKIVKRGLF